MLAYSNASVSVSLGRGQAMIRIALLSPKGPLYRHRGGIFKKSLRYAPLTLPTLASLIPREIEHELEAPRESLRGRESSST